MCVPLTWVTFQKTIFNLTLLAALYFWSHWKKLLLFTFIFHHIMLLAMKIKFFFLVSWCQFFLRFSPAGISCQVAVWPKRQIRWFSFSLSWFKSIFLPRVIYWNALFNCQASKQIYCFFFFFCTYDNRDIIFFERLTFLAKSFWFIPDFLNWFTQQLKYSMCRIFVFYSVLFFSPPQILFFIYYDKWVSD